MRLLAHLAMSEGRCTRRGRDIEHCLKDTTTQTRAPFASANDAITNRVSPAEINLLSVALFYGKLKTRRKSKWNWVPSLCSEPRPHAFSPPATPMSLFSTISVRRSGEERFVRNTYLAQRHSPVPTPFISPGDGIQYTKTPSCSSITPAPRIRAGLPGNWLVVDEHKV